MKFLFVALLPWLAMAAAHEAGEGRKLDATYVDPTPKPTNRPTPLPSSEPSPGPTISVAPSVSMQPTTPRPPECKGQWPFCWDGGPYGYRGYTTCYTLAESENCGTMDFMIEGMDATTRGSYDFTRCANVWDWFKACIESSYTSCTATSDGSFYSNSRVSAKPKIKYNKWTKEWQVTISGNSIWIAYRCGIQEDAKGIARFVNWLEGNELLRTPIATCDTPAPTVSVQPSLSLAPTEPLAPKCNATGMPPSVPIDERTFLEWKWSKGVTRIYKVDGTCTKWLKGKDVAGNDYKEYKTTLAWLKESAKLSGGQLWKDKDGQLTGETVPVESWIKYDCDSGNNDYRCVTLLDGPGVNGNLTWRFGEPKTWYADSFYNIWVDLSTKYPYMWLDDCGAGSFCYDDKEYTMCRVDPVSENCGEYDFVVEGSGEYYKTGNVLEFFGKCIESLGCYTKQQGELKGGDVDNKIKWWVNDEYGKNRQFQLYGNRMRKDAYFNCPDVDTVRKAEEIWDDIADNGLTQTKPWACTDSPTMSPTACSDSFFNNPPINIAVVIDTSFSTYEFKFGGNTKVKDLNNDGKSGTILDAEIAAVEALLDTILDTEELNNDNVDIGLITFDTEGKYEAHYPPLSPDNSEVNTNLLEAVRSIKTLKTDNEVLEQNVGFTNFDDALDATIKYFNDPDVPSDRTNLMVFLSDGKPNVRGDGDDEPWCPTDTDCSGAPANLPDDADTPEWESGRLSFCYSGDTETCFKPHTPGFEECARNDAGCLGADAAKSYGSELKELDRLGVHRLAIGVGKSSDVSVDSGLWLIDNNPMKISHNVLPRQVLNADDLIGALRDLCPENTPNPTDSPSSSPTAAPTVSPSRGPTDSPSDAPTGAPSASPTDDYCDYNVIDFTVGINDEATGDDYVFPYEWRDYGIRINAVTDERRDEGVERRAFYQDSGHAVAGKTIMVPQDDAGDNPPMNPNGGDIIITLDLTMDKFMRLDLFDVSGGGRIVTVDTHGEELNGILVDDSVGEVQEINVPVDGVYQVIVTFLGTGSLSQMNVCRDPRRTPSPVGLAPENETDEPTAAPTVPSLPVCVDDVKVLGQVGDFEFGDVPVRVIAQNGDTVTVELSNTFSRDIEYLYTQHYDSTLGTQQCVAHTSVTEVWTKRLTLYCMESAPVTVLRILASDGSLDAVKDDAQVPECCEGPENDPNPKALYVFQVYCETQCP